MSFHHICTYGACHSTITTVAKCHQSTHLYMYKLYTYYICITHMIFHYNIWRNDTRPLHVWWPPAGQTTVVIIHGEDIWSAVSFWFFRIFFFSLYFSLLRHSRYTDRTSPRLLLHCVEYYAWPKWQHNITHVPNN